MQHRTPFINLAYMPKGSKMTYSVVVYINHSTKEYSITARQTDADYFPIMDRNEAAKGYTRINIAEGLSKSQSEATKACQIAVQQNAGYTLIGRGPTKISTH